MNARSAAPWKQKIQTASNEFRRRMQNTHKHLPANHLEEALKGYTEDLKRGGFPESFIWEALDSATKRFTTLLKAEITGERPVNRPKSHGMKARVISKL